MPYGPDLIALVDERVRSGQSVTAKVGTVSDRDTTGARCMVIFDGSSGVPQPVKCFEDVVVAGGDRVGCIKFQSDWIVVGNYTLRRLADQALYFPLTTNTLNTTGTWTDMINSPSMSYTKMRDATVVRFSMSTEMFSTVTSTAVEVGVRVASLDGVVAYDLLCCHYFFSVANNQLIVSGNATSTVDQAGGYTVTGRWKRASGTGVLTTSGDDFVSMRAEEVPA